MTDRKDLEEYRKKRDPEKTPEPTGSGGGEGGGEPRFVIHRHDASTEHYDLRLEIGDALKSWAVPKGPSTDPSEKRLALPTEDHPLDYLDFEGVIPEDEYGGGTVMVWDMGGFRNLKEDDDGEKVPLADQYDDGHLTVWLDGEKVRGGYALTHVGIGDDGEGWLLVKMDDEEADARRKPTSTEPKSVKSGRTMKEIAAEGSETGERV